MQEVLVFIPTGHKICLYDLQIFVPGLGVMVSWYSQYLILTTQEILVYVFIYLFLEPNKYLLTSNNEFTNSMNRTPRCRKAAHPILRVIGVRESSRAITALFEEVMNMILSFEYLKVIRFPCYFHFQPFKQLMATASSGRQTRWR